MQVKKNSLLKVLRGYQTYHGIKELTVFDTNNNEYDFNLTEIENVKVCYSGSLEKFSRNEGLSVEMIVYRDGLFKRKVKHALAFHEKLFIWLN